MKKYLNLFVFALLVFSLFGVGQIALAVENSNSSSSSLDQKVKDLRENLKKEKGEINDEIRAEIQQIREDAKNKIEALRESIKNEKNKVKAKAAELRMTGREQALERFDKATERMSALKDKINAKISKFDEKGIDTTLAKNFITTAETKLDQIKAKITEVNLLLAGSTNQLTAETKTQLKALTSEIQNLIKEIHQTLNDAVKSLKNSINS